MLATTYHLGGYQPAAPAQNKAEQYDSVAGTYTRWNAAGAQVEQRAMTSAEVATATAADAAATRSTNDTALRDKALQAITANATFLAIASPTNAQVVAQTQRLTRENTAIIRLLIGALDTTDGT